jgi:hypothetical protein
MLRLSLMLIVALLLPGLARAQDTPVTQAPVLSTDLARWTVPAPLVQVTAAAAKWFVRIEGADTRYTLGSIACTATVCTGVPPAALVAAANVPDGKERRLKLTWAISDTGPESAASLPFVLAPQALGAPTGFAIVRPAKPAAR